MSHVWLSLILRTPYGIIFSCLVPLAWDQIIKLYNPMRQKAWFSQIKMPNLLLPLYHFALYYANLVNYLRFSQSNLVIWKHTYRKVASRSMCYYLGNRFFGGATNWDMSLNETCFYSSARDFTGNWKYSSIIKVSFFLKKFSGPDFSWLVLGPDMSHGQKCLRAGNVSAPDLSWLSLRPDLSQGQRCLRAGLVSRFAAWDVKGRKCLAAGSVPNFRAGSVSQPEVSQSLEPEVSRGRTWFAAVSVLEI